MKSLTESVQTALNESLEGMLQSRAEIISKNKKGEDEYGMIRLDHPVDIGENSACIDAINATGNIVRFDIDGSSDAVEIKFFSDTVLKEIVKELDAMVKKIK
jgi:hypothetical protein